MGTQQQSASAIYKPTAIRGDNDLLRRLLTDEEGKKNKAYKDTEGYWTIAIGHKLDQEQTLDELRAMGLDAPLTDWEGFELTDQQCHELLEIDIGDAIDDLYCRDPELCFTEKELDELGETRRAIILSMVFQLGGAGFRKFRNFIGAVKEGDFLKAAEEMMNSLAAQQTPARWLRASKAMELGYFAEYNNPKLPGEPTVQSVPEDPVSPVISESAFRAYLDSLNESDLVIVLRKLADKIEENSKKFPL